jgi:hypothetical protein
MNQGHLITFRLDLDPGHGSSVRYIWRLLAGTGSFASQVAVRLGGFDHNPPSKDLTGSAKGSLTYDGVTADAVIRVYDETRNVIETYGHAGDFREF